MDPLATALALMLALARGDDAQLDVIEGQLDRDTAVHVAVALAGQLWAAWQQAGLDPLQTAGGMLAARRAQN